jgi:hypothetical protein
MISNFLLYVRQGYYIFYLKKIRYPDRISDFHIFQSDSDSSVFDICHLFISWISIDSNIKK